MTQEIIDQLNMIQHPEGGWYQSVYQSELTVSIASDKRSIGSSIYYYLSSDDFSAWHRLASDEIWYFHCGSGLTLHLVDADGECAPVLLGDMTENEPFVSQYLIPAGSWCAAEVSCDNAFALTSRAAFPGRDVSDVELADIAQLKKEFPDHCDIFSRLSRS